MGLASIIKTYFNEENCLKITIIMMYLVCITNYVILKGTIHLRDNQLTVTRLANAYKMTPAMRLAEIPQCVTRQQKITVKSCGRQCCAYVCC